MSVHAGRWLLRHRTAVGFLHGNVFHRRRSFGENFDQGCWLCTTVWKAITADHGETLRRMHVR